MVGWKNPRWNSLKGPDKDTLKAIFHDLQEFLKNPSVESINVPTTTGSTPTYDPVTDTTEPVAVTTINVEQTVPDDGASPTTPTGLTVTGSIGAIRLVWNENTEVDMANGFGEYHIEVDDTDNTFASVIYDAHKGGHNTTVSGLNAEQEYWVRIMAHDAHGNHSAWSSAVSATVPVETILKTASTGERIEIDGNSVNLFTGTTEEGVGQDREAIVYANMISNTVTDSFDSVLYLRSPSGGSLTSFPASLILGHTGVYDAAGGESVAAWGHDPKWETFTLRNSWANYGGAHPDAEVTITPDGTVHLRGALKTGSGNICNAGDLPLWARPAYQMNIPVDVSGTGTMGTLRVNADGSMDVVNSSATFTAINASWLTGQSWLYWVDDKYDQGGAGTNDYTDVVDTWEAIPSE